MVFFTCNHCGESVKKPSVEKHYNFKCRGAPKNVSCMDCQKDFHGEEYVAHTKCISEAEKYSGKDYVHKESKNSGQKKQDNWMDIIRSILETKEYNLSPPARAAFQKLQSVDNVPRKKAKFINFTQNCMRMRKDHVEEVWSVLEKELEKMKAAKAAALAATQNKEPAKPEVPQIIIEKAPEQPAEEGKVKSIGDEVETMRIKKSKSKKRKIDKEIQNTIEQDEEIEIMQMVKKEVEKDQVGATVEPSKKKSKKSSTATADDTAGKQAEVNAEQEPTISTTTPDEFQWSLVILFTVKKYGNTMKLDKLKRKVQKMYLTKREWSAFNEKQQMKFDKKFAKHVKKCNLKIENNVVSVE